MTAEEVFFSFAIATLFDFLLRPVITHKQLIKSSFLHEKYIAVCRLEKGRRGGGGDSLFNDIHT